MTEYITIENGLVTGHFASISDTVPEGAIVVTDFLAPTGFYLEEDYEKKDGYTVLKPNIELYKNGHLPIPEGMKLNADKTDICPLENIDLLRMGKMTVEEFNEAQKQKRQDYYAERLDPYTLRMNRKRAINEWTAADEDEYHALCDKISLEVEELFPYES